MYRSILDHTINHENGKCSCCKTKEVETKSVRISVDDGFCQSGFTVFICGACYGKPTLLGESYFRKVGDELFYEYNGNYGLFDCLEPVRNYNHFQYLKNKHTKDYLRNVRFSDERYGDL